MIKTFEQFTNNSLNEMKEQCDLYRDFSVEYYDFLHKCQVTNIEIVKHLGGKFEIPSDTKYPLNILIYKHSDTDHRNRHLVSVRINSFIVKENKKINFPILDNDKNSDGEYLVAIDTNGNEIDISIETCPESQLVSINDTLQSYL